MKIEEIYTFSPVIITCETQDEVNLIFAVFNFSEIKDCLGSLNSEAVNKLYNELVKFYGPGYKNYHAKLYERFKK